MLGMIAKDTGKMCDEGEQALIMLLYPLHNN